MRSNRVTSEKFLLPEACTGESGMGMELLKVMYMMEWEWRLVQCCMEDWEWNYVNVIDIGIDMRNKSGTG